MQPEHHMSAANAPDKPPLPPRPPPFCQPPAPPSLHPLVYLHSPHGMRVMLQVGSEVARRARGLGMICIAHDPFASEAKAAALGVRLVGLDEALAQGDFFSLHMPLTAQTKVCLAA